MTPSDFADKYPKLYHLTRPEVLPLIEKYGLLSPAQLCELFEVSVERREEILTRRRPKSVRLTHPEHGHSFIHDNAPLSEKALLKCLDDGLSPKEWIEALNSRVFLFTALKKAETLSSGPAHSGERRSLLVIDTQRFLEEHIDRVSISPINTGSTIHTPARRGHSTFAQLAELDFDVWRRSRPKKSLDIPNEVSVVGGIPNIFKYVLEVAIL